MRAQAMFDRSFKFNQPVAAWDVGKVTTMRVRRWARVWVHTAAQRSGHKPCACAGAAQEMFSRATSFNQPVAAWDIGQVTSMSVRRCPAS